MISKGLGAKGLRTKGQHQGERIRDDQEERSGNVFTGFLVCSWLLLPMAQYSLQMNTAVLSWQELCLRIWWEFVVFRDIYVVCGLLFFYHLLTWDCVTK